MPVFKNIAIGAVYLALTVSAGAQTSGTTKVTPGNEATKAVGSQVPAEKVECPDRNATSPQGQHAPTAAVGNATPTMTAPGECPAATTPPAADQKK